MSINNLDALFQLRDDLLKLADTYDDRGLFLRKLVKQLDSLSADDVQYVLIKLSTLLKAEAAFETILIKKIDPPRDQILDNL